jgi:hypothetical protein
MQSQVSSASMCLLNSKGVQQGGCVSACTMHYCVVAISEQRGHNSIAHFQLSHAPLLCAATSVIPPLAASPKAAGGHNVRFDTASSPDQAKGAAAAAVKDANMGRSTTTYYDADDEEAGLPDISGGVISRRAVLRML